MNYLAGMKDLELATLGRDLTRLNSNTMPSYKRGGRRARRNGSKKPKVTYIFLEFESKF
jgi:hypothetical protein